MEEWPPELCEVVVDVRVLTGEAFADEGYPETEAEIGDDVARYTQIDGEDRDLLVGESALDWLCGFLGEFFDDSSDDSLWIPKSLIVDAAETRGMSLSTLDRALKSAQEMNLIERQKRGREAHFRVRASSSDEHMSCVISLDSDE